ncbi:hypothetical protein [Aegicerativicinus sediminis]|uniref:hypothetical protein n=1 Tax=Aegicerativicinus sediminis TaxID=2893202 RepID=UPI001E49C40E|nr:hypothetical protein [Aegicerativicinus sediminis]
MKFFKIIVAVLFLFTGVKGMAQFQDVKPWSVGLSYNIVDDSSLRFEEFFDIGEHWNTTIIPATFHLEYVFARQFSGEAALSFNRFIPQYETFYDPPEDRKFYVGFDLNSKFYFLKEDDFRRDDWQPYVIAGFGFSTVDTLNWFHFNFGVGLTYWIDNVWGVTAQTTGKWTFDLSDSTNYKHHMIGVRYIFAD